MTPPFDLRTAPLDGGTILLEASAGTGKTYSLVGLLLRMLLEGKIASLDRALVVTFTVAATEELKNRLRAALQTILRVAQGRETANDPFFEDLAGREGAIDRLQNALAESDQFSITTIHGFCKRLIEEAAFESREPFQVEFTDDPLPYRQDAAADALRAYYDEKITAAGALLGIEDLGPKKLVELYGKWQRYPDVALDPEEPDPDRHLAAVEAAARRAAGELDEEAMARIRSIRWTKNAPFDLPDRYDPARLQRRAERNPLLALRELRLFAPDELRGRAGRRPPPDLDHPFFDACDEVAAACRTAIAHLRSALLRAMHERLLADKKREHVMDFHDLLTRTHEALHDPERSRTMLRAVRARHDVALIDEFQDTDQLQYEIFEACFPDRTMYLIGDPKQSIYGFRGADLRVYARAFRRADERFTLTVNWRSNDRLVEAVQVLCGKRGAFVDPGIDLPPITPHRDADRLTIGEDGAPPLQWRYLPRIGRGTSTSLEEQLILRDVTAEISRLLRGRPLCDGRALRPRDIAVLCRTNKQASDLQEHLRGAGIAATVSRAGDVLETEEADEVEVFLRGVLQPGRVPVCLAAMATRIHGMTAEDLAAIRLEEIRLESELERFESWRETWREHGIFAMLEQALADRDTAARLLPHRGGERRLTNLQQIAEMLHHAEHAHSLRPEALLDFLRAERSHRGKVDRTTRELRLESDAEAVQLLTMHNAKGLQFEVVFCPFLWKGKRPRGSDLATDGTRRRLVPNLVKDHPLMPDTDLWRLAEDCRLAYVALTRARRRCYVHVGPIPGFELGAISWLLNPLPPPSAEKPIRGEDYVRHTEELGKDPERIRRWVDELVAANGDLMACVDVPPDPDVAPLPPPPVEVLEEPRRPTRRPTPRDLASFSSLVADGEREAAPRDTADPSAPVDAEDVPGGIFAFARGPRAGNCLHEILERHDWRAADGEAALRARVSAALRDHGLDDPSAHRGDIDPVETVVQSVRDLERALPVAGGPTLADVCRGRRRAEWEFLLTTDEGAVRALAGLFEQHGSALARRYAPRIADRPARVVRGFLRGFVDLVAEHDGRYWVIDWKSNHLGNAGSDYDTESMEAAMLEHDYVLQYHLYALALHRHLRHRLPDYDPKRHFAGVTYVFLRGAVPGTNSGMFFDRPGAAMLDALDRWAGEAGR